MVLLVVCVSCVCFSVILQYGSVLLCVCVFVCVSLWDGERLLSLSDNCVQNVKQTVGGTKPRGHSAICCCSSCIYGCVSMCVCVFVRACTVHLSYMHKMQKCKSNPCRCTRSQIGVKQILEVSFVMLQARINNTPSLPPPLPVSLGCVRRQQGQGWSDAHLEYGREEEEERWKEDKQQLSDIVFPYVACVHTCVCVCSAIVPVCGLV